MLGLDLEAEAGGDAHGAQAADRVLAQPDVRVADRADEPALEVLEAVDVIDDREVGDAVEQAVDREVAPPGVLLGRAEGVVALDQQVDVVREAGLLAEGRDLDHLAAAEQDVGEAEAPADEAAVAEQVLDLLRVGRGRDVEILHRAVQQQVAHAAADQVRGVVVAREPAENLQRVLVDPAARDRVLLALDDDRRRRP